ncbi:hypothetical protein [Kordiimonas aquimaris]|uniref:hypothetical protein n=1 Tax=Kordiimonas aquimaris TaxID=707591 RepID=UPI0021CE9C66|nr:hypothetical protein [Kordiimonas aquimaris]
MKPQALSVAVKNVIAEIQAISGYDCPEIKGDTKPGKDIQNFTSEIWPTASAMISAYIGKQIPAEENIFYNEKTHEELTLDECVQRIMAVVVENDNDSKTNGLTT